MSKEKPPVDSTLLLDQFLFYMHAMGLSQPMAFVYQNKRERERKRCDRKQRSRVDPFYRFSYYRITSVKMGETQSINCEPRSLRWSNITASAPCTNAHIHCNPSNFFFNLFQINTIDTNLPALAAVIIRNYTFHAFLRMKNQNANAPLSSIKPSALRKFKQNFDSWILIRSVCDLDQCRVNGTKDTWCQLSRTEKCAM